MGRKRSFDEGAVLAAAGRAFLTAGFEGTSIDELVRATGLLRGSLYQAFGSKRGLFLAVLRQGEPAPAGDADLDLLLIATLELAPRDDEVRDLVRERLGGTGDPAHLLGHRLLARAGLAAPAGHEGREEP